jgi:hypothetical protein
MPYYFEFDSLNGILRGRFEGEVTDKELKEYCRDSMERIASTSSRASITDLSAVTSFDISRQTILELADVRPILPDHEPLRIIIADSPHVFGMARMFELEGRSAHPNVHVVHTNLEAWAVLGIKEPKFTPYKN